MIARKRIESNIFPPTAALIILGAASFLALNSAGYAWLGILAFAIAFILIGQIVFNQYLEIDALNGTMSKPMLYFFRTTEKLEGVAIEAEHTVDEEGKSHYSMTISGDFGTIETPLPDYESYATAIYQKVAANLL